MTINDEWQRPGPTVRQRRVDLVIALVVMGGALLNVMLSRSSGLWYSDARPSAVEQLLWAVAVTVPLTWRRRYPEAVMVVTAVVFIAGQVRNVQEAVFASYAIFAAIYTVGAWGRNRPLSRWLRIAVIGSMFCWLAVAWLIAADAMPEGGPPGATGELPPLLASIISSVLVNMLLFGFFYIFGETVWLAVRREHQLGEQARELREARAAADERAVFGERVRIARELHDVVAHHVSVMGIQAAAARRAMRRDTDRAEGALTAVEEGARTAVEELHRMLGALRPATSAPGDAGSGVGAASGSGSGSGSDPSPGASSAADAPLAPFTHAASPGIGRLGDLADRVRAAGLGATCAVYGDPVPLPASLSQTAYRLVQEAITNTLKHSGASEVDVRVRYLSRELEIDVADDGRGAASTQLASGGLGLLGMRERVALLGGTVEAGPRASGGFRVRARVPLHLPAQRTPEPRPDAPPQTAATSPSSPDGLQASAVLATSDPAASSAARTLPDAAASSASPARRTLPAPTTPSGPAEGVVSA